MSNWRGTDFWQFLILLLVSGTSASFGFVAVAVVAGGLALLTLAEMVLHVIGDSMKDEEKAG